MSGINNFNINLLNDTDRLKDMLSNNTPNPTACYGGTNLLSLQARTLRIRVNDNNENILHIYCKDKRCKRSGALHGEEDQAIKEIIEIFYEYAPHAFMQQTKLEKQTPLHFAMKSGNIQKAKAIFEVLSRNTEGKLAKEVQDSSLENNSSLGNLFNILDYNGMRAIDLLAIRQDTEYKKSITGDLEEDKLETPKISKNYDVYSWRTYDSYPDGVHTFRHDAPKLLDFEEDPESNKIFSQTSITHVEMNEDYSMALTEDGQVYSWGMGPKGKLGLGEKEFTQAPGKVNFVHYSKIDKIQGSQSLKEFELEYQQIKESKSKITKLGGREQLIHLYSTATNFNSLRGDKKSFGNRKKNSSHKRSFGKERSFTDEDLFKEDGIDDDLQADSHGYEQLGTHKSDMINMHLFWSAIEKVYVTQISCSENHTLACTNTGSVYGWGSNEFSQLGFQSHRENTLYISCPKKIFGSIKKSCIQRVAAGDKHSLALSVEGLVHGWGDNHSSQLGLTSIDGEIVPKPVELDCVNNFTGSKSRRIKIIRAKGDTSLFLSESSR